MAVVATADINPSGMVKMPQDMMEAIGVREGGKIMLVMDGGTLRIVNPAIYAMEQLRSAVGGDMEAAGIRSEEDAVALAHQLRHGGKA